MRCPSDLVRMRTEELCFISILNLIFSVKRDTCRPVCDRVSPSWGLGFREPESVEKARVLRSARHRLYYGLLATT